MTLSLSESWTPGNDAADAGVRRIDWGFMAKNEFL
jgi:hypothetical protein